MPAVSRGKEDSECLSEEELEDQSCIAWSGVSRKIPVLIFHAEAAVSKDRSIRSIGERYNLAFKIVRTESRLVRGILLNHGFHEVHPNNNDFNLMWTGSHLKTYQLCSLQDFQKVNHFPRSSELTRKDRLYKNIQRMQQIHGFLNFHIVPQTFVLPAEYQEFCTSFSKDKGPWIIKPVASSRGRGIYLVSTPSQIPLEENILVSRYINNPSLIDDFKFDVRLYVLVTSYDPVIIYVYEEGLTRFATVKYDHAVKNIKNQFMHLTNYSVNKKSSDYVSCDDPEVEDYGNKWSMSAMLRYLRQEGKDTTLLMNQIEDLIIKAVLSAEIQIATACKMSVPHRSNCFELYGFDVLIDSNLKPWLLEVNLSPSLACDTPLDLKIKASMISDMFSLVGFVCQDPLLKQMRTDKTVFDHGMKSQTQKTQATSARSKVFLKSQSASNTDAEEQIRKHGRKYVDTLDLTAEELKVLRRTQEEHERRGGFVRIFPTPHTWERYSGYLEYKTSMNSMLANKLFHERKKLKPNVPLETEALITCHVLLYERKLLSLEERRRHRKTCRATTGRRKTGGKSSPCSHSSKEEEASECEKQELQKSTNPTNPKVDLLIILQQGWNLSKVQARVAFSSYLHRVQMRLLEESRATTTSAWAQKDSDQMELVMRFLKKAARNLQRDVQVGLPSRQLSLADRQRILAYQLGEFIHCYKKETEQMLKSLEKTPDEDRCINPSVFQEFILEASESGLEDVLTFYTQKNKSSSVFLGTKCSSADSGEPAKPHSRKTLLNGNHNPDAPESSVTTVRAIGAKNEIQECTSKPESSKSSKTVYQNSHSNTIQSGDHKYIVTNHTGPLTTLNTQNNDSKVNNTQDEDTGSERPNLTVVENNDTSTQALKVGDVQFKTLRSCKSHAIVRGSQHTSSYPAALDCEQIYLQQRLLASNPETRKDLQPPRYVQPPPHESQKIQQTTSSSVSASTLQPARVIRPSSSSNLTGPTLKTEVLHRSQHSQSAQPFINGVSVRASSGPSASEVSSQQFTRASSAGHVTQKVSKFRPASAGVLKEQGSLAAQAQSNQQAIVTALKKLVEKQAARQYSTSSHISLLTQHLTNLNLANGVFSRGTLGPIPVVQPDTTRTQQSALNPSATLSRRSTFEDDVSQAACNLPPGVTLQPSYQPPLGSYQLQFAIQQLQQQQVQSKKLLDQSRSRHQAMLAGHTLMPCAVPENSLPVGSVCGVQVSQQSQTVPKQSGSQSSLHYAKPYTLTPGPTILTPKPPSSTLKDTFPRKSATQRINKPVPSTDNPSRNGTFSRQHVVYDTICGKTGQSVYSKLFQTLGTNTR
ncbi:tubulin polyglutamylase TTLL5 isoform X2 [Trichomycterus rosablanca]|uniref:tubulin polyglutamylase TTLL5 isoform X2 n=1 Tax=Trichomycterus rosablanca TaxID=2290929 RepID=UPI002F356261